MLGELGQSGTSRLGHPLRLATRHAGGMLRLGARQVAGFSATGPPGEEKDDAISDIILKFSNVWQLPNTAAGGVLRQIVNDWMLNTIVSWQSG